MCILEILTHVTAAISSADAFISAGRSLLYVVKNNDVC